eukprot:4376981-Pleurochrysis_carterae.AAC.1
MGKPSAAWRRPESRYDAPDIAVGVRRARSFERPPKFNFFSGESIDQPTQEPRRRQMHAHKQLQGAVVQTGSGGRNVANEGSTQLQVQIPDFKQPAVRAVDNVQKQPSEQATQR